MAFASDMSGSGPFMVVQMLNAGFSVQAPKLSYTVLGLLSPSSFDNKPEARNTTETLRSQGHKKATGRKELDPPVTF